MAMRRRIVNAFRQRGGRDGFLSYTCFGSAVHLCQRRSCLDLGRSAGHPFKIEENPYLSNSARRPCRTLKPDYRVLGPLSPCISLHIPRQLGRKGADELAGQLDPSDAQGQASYFLPCHGIYGGYVGVILGLYWGYIGVILGSWRIKLKIKWKMKWKLSQG